MIEKRPSLSLIALSRGGVEDTRLEAKAKDTKKKSEAKDSLSEDRHSRGQGQECSRPRPRTKDTSASALQKKKKDLLKNFSGDLQKKKKKKGHHKNFSSDLHKILTVQKILLSSSRGQANFRGFEASRPRPRTSKSVIEDSTSGIKLSSASFYYILFLLYRQIWNLFGRSGKSYPSALNARRSCLLVAI